MAISITTLALDQLKWLPGRCINISNICMGHSLWCSKFVLPHYSRDPCFCYCWKNLPDLDVYRWLQYWRLSVMKSRAVVELSQTLNTLPPWLVMLPLFCLYCSVFLLCVFGCIDWWMEFFLKIILVQRSCSLFNRWLFSILSWICSRVLLLSTYWVLSSRSQLLTFSLCLFM